MWKSCTWTSITSFKWWNSWSFAFFFETLSLTLFLAEELAVLRWRSCCWDNFGVPTLRLPLLLSLLIVVRFGRQMCVSLKTPTEPTTWRVAVDTSLPAKGQIFCWLVNEEDWRGVDVGLGLKDWVKVILPAAARIGEEDLEGGGMSMATGLEGPSEPLLLIVIGMRPPDFGEIKIRILIT